MKDIQAINKWLKQEFGKQIDGRPNWRIIWSEDEREVRKGTFTDWYGHIIVRTVREIRNLRKYEYHPDWRERWILEKLIFGVPNPEIFNQHAGSYEPIYVFRDHRDKYIRPTMKGVQFYMREVLSPKIIITDWDSAEQKEIDQEAEENYGYMQDKFGGDEATALHYKEAVVNTYGGEYR
jgi:hypothetical protein